MMSLVQTDPRLRLLTEALDARGNPSDDEAPETSNRMEAAVSMVVRTGARLEFLLIKRASSERDPWSGQMALPGGRWEPADGSLLHTAVRETLEETGVDLSTAGLSLGRLEDVKPASPRLPKMRIAPFVFAVPHDTPAEVASAELQSVHWVPVDALRTPETNQSVDIDFGDVSRSFPSYALVGEHVWGLTHRILTDFLSVYPDG